MKIFIRLLFIFCLALAILSPSCAPEACLEETESYLKASLYENSTKKSPDSLTLYGINHETDKIYNKISKLQPALFPLDKSADNCTFVIRINGTTDTIKFSYTSRPHFISKECGYTIYHNLVDTPYYTKHIIDKIYVASRNITTLNEENIRIFY
jgi:hypothetical protein